MAYQKQFTVSRGLNTEPGIAKLVALFHHSHQIVDSRHFTERLLQIWYVLRCFVLSFNFSCKLIINTALKKQLGMSHRLLLLLMVIWLAQVLLSFAKFPTTLRIKKKKKKRIILLTLDWVWGRPQALIQWRHVSSVRTGLANGTKRTPSQNWRNLLSELHVPYKAWSAFLMPFLPFLNLFFKVSIFITDPMYPQPKRTCSALHLQALTECSHRRLRMGLIWNDSLLFELTFPSSLTIF